MPRRKSTRPPDDWLFPNAGVQSADRESSLLDVVDSILNKGAVLNGDLILGVANVDLVYAKLSVLIAALDRIMQPADRKSKTRRGARKTKRSAER
jgi:Gas vesicle protein